MRSLTACFPLTLDVQALGSVDTEQKLSASTHRVHMQSVFLINAVTEKKASLTSYTILARDSSLAVNPEAVTPKQRSVTHRAGDTGVSSSSLRTVCVPSYRPASLGCASPLCVCVCVCVCVKGVCVCVCVVCV